MRTTVTLDDELLDRAAELTGISERGLLLREALRALIEKQSAIGLTNLGGSQPGMDQVPRRRRAP